MKRIVFIGGNLSINKGGAALIISSYESIKNSLINIEFCMTSFFYETDILMQDRYSDILIIPELKKRFPFNSGIISWMYYSILAFSWNLLQKLNIELKLNDNILDTYLKSDLIIEISGDGLSGDYGISTFFSLSRLLTGILLHKKIFIYAQSIGPFKIKFPKTKHESKLLSFICLNYARFVLNRVKLITVREEISYNILKKMTLSNNQIYLTADSAFLLEPISKDKTFEILSTYNIHKNDKFIGISLSNSIGDLQYDTHNLKNTEEYKNIMVNVIDYVIKEFNVKVLLIPHVTGPGQENDDRIIATDLVKKLNNNENVINLIENFTPNELKGIIGNCVLFMGSRMHANIAGISMAVPTLAIGYSHKTMGIMNMANQKEFILNFQDLNFDIIIKKLNNMWINKDTIKMNLAKNLEPIQKEAFENVVLTKELLNS